MSVLLVQVIVVRVVVVIVVVVMVVVVVVMVVVLVAVDVVDDEEVAVVDVDVLHGLRLTAHAQDLSLKSERARATMDRAVTPR